MSRHPKQKRRLPAAFPLPRPERGQGVAVMPVRAPERTLEEYMLDLRWYPEKVPLEVEAAFSDEVPAGR